MEDVTLHVIPTPTGGWAIKRSGAKRCSAVYVDFDDAVCKALEVAYCRKFIRVMVHDADGRIIRVVTYGE